MPYGLYIAAEGAHAQDRRLTVLANNLANVDTVGFKRQLAIFQARYTEPIARGNELPGSGRWTDLSGGVVVSMTKTDFSQGPLKETRSPFDFAIRGDGFFTVQKDNEVFLTRAGNFQLNGNGQLVTQFGGDQYLVLNDAGQPIVLDGSRPWRVNAQGVVEQQGMVQNIAVVRPTSKDSLLPVGENLFRSTTQPEPVPLPQRQIAQGYLEMSSVQPTLAMVELLEASRLLEANLAMVQTQDQMLSNLFNRVLRTT